MANAATTWADDLRQEIGGNHNIDLTFRALAATSYSKGDFVTIDTAGRVAINTTDDASIDGVVMRDVDNSSGANDDLVVPVRVQGNVYVDGLFSASGGAYDDAAAIGTQMSCQGDSGTTAAEGQALVAISGASNQQFTSLTVHALPSSGNELVTMLAFFQGSGIYN